MSPHRVKACGLVLLVGGLVLGCGRTDDELPSLFVAASLMRAMEDAVGRYEAERGVSTRLTTAGSQVLRRQIEAGAPADLFVPASPRHVAEGRDPEGAMSEGFEALDPLVCNALVLAVPADSPLHELRDLPEAQRIVLGVPEVPVGEYADRMLDRAGERYGRSWRDRVTAHVRSRELDVRQVMSKLVMGEADAAIVYATDVRSGARAIRIPEPLNERAEYPIALLRGAPTPARNLRDWLLGDGRGVLLEHGFEGCE